MSHDPDNPDVDGKPGKLTGCVQVLLVIFLLIAGMGLAFYFTVWRVPDRSREMEPHSERARERLEQANSIPEDRNTWYCYRDAVSRFRSINSPSPADSCAALFDKGLTPETLGPVRTLRGRNRESLALVRKGYRRDTFQIPVYYQLGSQANTLRYLTYREFWRFLILAGDEALARGAQREALEFYLQALCLGKGIGRNSFLLPTMIGQSCEIDTMQHLMPFLSRQDLPASLQGYALGELQRLDRGAPDFRGVLEEEMLLLGYDFAQYRHTRGQTPSLAFRYGIVDLGREERIAQGFLLRFWENSQHPFRQALAEMKTTAAYEPFFSSIATANMGSFSTWDQTFIAFSHTKSCYGGLLLTTALNCCRNKKGAWPGSLGDLVPRWLPSLPSDPFSPMGTYVYREKNGGVLLYSIGENLIDDGGRGTAGKFFKTEDIVFLSTTGKKKS
jgi:hypothetical protein